MLVIKKYGNRRLYDTAESRYVTLEELAAKIRGGTDARVVDAKSGEDLTQSTLAQIILESRGAAALLPVPLLSQLIRMGDDALAEFFGRYLAGALELYVQARHGAQSVASYNPFATLPFSAGNAFARLLGGGGGGSPFLPDLPQQQQQQQPQQGADLAQLRRELDELKRSMRPPAVARAKSKPRKKR